MGIFSKFFQKFRCPVIPPEPYKSFGVTLNVGRGIIYKYVFVGYSDNAASPSFHAYFILPAPGEPRIYLSGQFTDAFWYIYDNLNVKQQLLNLNKARPELVREVKPVPNLPTSPLYVTREEV